MIAAMKDFLKEMAGVLIAGFAIAWFACFWIMIIIFPFWLLFKMVG